MLADKDVHSLEALNRALWTYVEMDYHRSIHRILGEAPLDCWARVGHKVRYPEVDVNLDDLFLFETRRKIQKDRTVSLNGVVYEIDASLVGETVTLRYNPADQGNLIEVCHNGRFIQQAKRVDTYANCFVKRDRPSSSLTEVTEKGQTAKRAGNKPSTIRHTIDFSKITDVDADKEGSDV
jgi:hypothetical protein